MPFDVALDRASVRAYSRDDGRLYVRVSHISKACVNPYNGREIPRAEALGLDPDRVYMLLRDPEELARSVPTWNGLPLLIKHTPMSADDHQRDVVVGSLGTEAAFRAPYLDNSLAVWDGEAIAGVESGELRELSGGYHYDADMTPGVWNGERYDGVMRNIRGNHVALVESGRAGNDVMVMDSAMPASGKDDANRKGVTMGNKVAARPRRAAAIPPRMLVTAGALQAYLPPRLAQDAKMPDVLRLIQGARDGKEVASRVRVALKPLLAQDADLSDLDGLIDHLKGGEEGGLPAPAMRPADETRNPSDTGLGDPEGTNEAMLSEDDDLEEKIRELLAGKLDDADMEMLMKLIHPVDVATVDPDSDKDGAPPPDDAAARPDDAPPPPPRKDDADDRRFGRDRRRGRDAMPPQLEEDKVDRPAMDVAIRAATKAAVDEAIRTTTQRLDARAAAERFVRPWIGEVTVAMDSADDVYRTALDACGVDVKGVHPSAYKAMLALVPKPGDAQPRARVAMDSAGGSDFAARFPGAARLRVVG